MGLARGGAAICRSPKAVRGLSDDGGPAVNREHREGHGHPGASGIGAVVRPRKTDFPLCQRDAGRCLLLTQEPEAWRTVRGEGHSISGMTSLRCLWGPRRDLRRGRRTQRSEQKRKGPAGDIAWNPTTHQPSSQPRERTEGHTQRTATHGAGLGRDAKQRRGEVTREGGATEGGVGERTFQSRSDR